MDKFKAKDEIGVSPLFSVVTVVRNRADLIQGCVDSVRRQRDVSVEHIVIDGASNDGTAEILLKQRDLFAHLCSEPDNGIADAMNKGLQHASGEWVLFLHADDELIGDHALHQVAKALEASTVDIVGFPVKFGSGQGQRVVKPRGGTALLRLKTGFLHQATFVRRLVFTKIGGFDQHLKIVMDYEFFLRAWIRGIGMTTFTSPIPTLMRDTGISSRTDWPSLVQRFNEERSVHLKHADSLWRLGLYFLYWHAYLPYRAMRSFVLR